MNKVMYDEFGTRFLSEKIYRTVMAVSPRRNAEIKWNKEVQ